MNSEKMMLFPTSAITNNIMITLFVVMFVLAQFSASVEGGEIVEEIMEEEEMPTATAHKEHANLFIDADQLGAFIVREMKKDFGESSVGNKLTREAKQAKVGLLASLFPDLTEEKGQEAQQLENGINGIFEKGLFDNKALPDMILRRIDQLALRPYMEMLTKKLDKMDKTDAAEEEKKQLLMRKKEKETAAAVVAENKSSNGGGVSVRSIIRSLTSSLWSKGINGSEKADAAIASEKRPLLSGKEKASGNLETDKENKEEEEEEEEEEEDYGETGRKELNPRAQRNNVHLYQAAQPAMADALQGAREATRERNFSLESKLLRAVMDEMTVSELERKIGIKLSEPLYWHFREDGNQHRIISSNPRFLSLKLVTKVRLFFYRWLYDLIYHMDPAWRRRSELYRKGAKAYKLVPGEAFQLYLAEWLQNTVVNPLGQRIMLELIDQQQQRSWEWLLPFCVHMSLRPFFNYAERLNLDHRFHLEKLIDSGVSVYDVESNLHEVIDIMARDGKTVKKIVKLIRDEIFANLPLPNGSPMRSGIEQALQSAINGLGETANEPGDKQVLLQFFAHFYRELYSLASPKWLQTLTDTVPMPEPAKEVKTNAIEQGPKPLTNTNEHLGKLKVSSTPQKHSSEGPSKETRAEIPYQKEKRETEMHGHPVIKKRAMPKKVVEDDEHHQQQPQQPQHQQQGLSSSIDVHNHGQHLENGPIAKKNVK